MPPKNEKGKQRKMAMKQVRSAIKGLMQGEDTFEQAADKAFSELDTDGSGFLEKAELLSALNSLIGAGEDERAIPEKKFEKFFGKLDTDGDEKISKDEFKTLAKRLFKQLQKRISAEWRRGPARGDIPRRRPDREADRVARSRRRTWPTRPGFSVGDVNRSGPVRLVSLTSDISRVGPRDNMKKAVNTAFEKLDTDGSGFLEKEELFEALNELGADDDENEDGKISKEEFGKRPEASSRRCRSSTCTGDPGVCPVAAAGRLPPLGDTLHVTVRLSTALCPDVLLLHSAASQTYDMRAVVARCRTVCTVGTNPFDASMSVTLNLSFFPQADGEDDDD
ncbi:hypothetical protein Bbelb_432530 [Branchiostoma belcheri]|nr:hypothetical protein Bbelb_432530 [Branchiostoma belcheri]